MGDCPEQLMELTRGRTKAVVIANATDTYPPADRPEAVDRELSGLSALGFSATELDLRDYFERGDVAVALSDADLLWIRGGDTFALRYSLAKSGADRKIVRLLQDDAVAYGGYSAGICVLAPTLRGLEISDDPQSVQRLLEAETLWEGLGILDFCIVPHIGAPGHPGDATCEQIAERYRADGTPHTTLHDGEVLMIDGKREWRCG